MVSFADSPLLGNFHAVMADSTCCVAQFSEFESSSPTITF